MRPYSQQYDEHYWSGGCAEKEYVFLKGNNLAERFAGAAGFAVAEFGFGTALNFLLTARLWQSVAAAGGRLIYMAYEEHPLAAEEIADFHSGQPLLDAFLAGYAPQPGWNSQNVANTTLHLYVGQAGVGIAAQPARADAWFLDGFSPAKNPELWTPGLFQQAAWHSQPGATFATYSAARAVREALTQAGFVWHKHAGHPPKRHMLRGMLRG